MPDLYHYLQQLINGLTVGSTYALIAIGYTMVYGIIGMINFAHGDVYMVSAYLAAIGIAGLTTIAGLTHHVTGEGEFGSIRSICDAGMARGAKRRSSSERPRRERSAS